MISPIKEMARQYMDTKCSFTSNFGRNLSFRGMTKRGAVLSQRCLTTADGPSRDASVGLSDRHYRNNHSGGRELHVLTSSDFGDL